jgi:peptide/nickel transport system permease protein
MFAYGLQRVGLGALIVLVSMAMMFGMVFLVPGDPASVALGPRATPEMIALFRAEMGMDRPVAEQFLRFIANALLGDLGTDVWTGRSVRSAIAEALPHTLVLALIGLGWPLLVGVPVGCIAAVRRNSWIDRVAGLFSVAAIAIPSFVVALYALLGLSLGLGWFPVIGAGKPGDLADQAWHLVLPAFAIGLGWVGYVARMVRASMIEVLGENHVRTARAFGVKRRRIVFVYALRVAVLPTVALIGVGFGKLLSGAVFVEIVFARPGMGKLVFDAVAARNYSVVMGAVLVTTALYVVCTVLADLLAASLDPRARDGG